MKIKKLTKDNGEKLYYYDVSKYEKQIICNICQCKLNVFSQSVHIKSENHKLAVQLRSISMKPIEDIKKTILEYKMIQKFQKRKLTVDSSSTTSTLENNNDLVLSEENEDSKQEVNSNISITIEKIRHKTDVYYRELAHRAERYEKTKGIPKLVNDIKNIKTRLTNFKNERYYHLLNKYPENELLLSIKHLVPDIVIKPPKELKPKELKPKAIKQSKKKFKNIETNEESPKQKYEIIEYPKQKYEIIEYSNCL
jgi:hypothetical protein